MDSIKLTARQEKIILIIRDSGPITGNAIAKLLNVTRAALRSDLAILTMLNIVDARPKLGYFYTGKQEKDVLAIEIDKIKVDTVLSQPVVVRGDTNVYDTIVALFTEDVGTVFVCDDEILIGVVSRKDLLRATLGNNDLHNLPVRLVMTPVSKIIYAELGDGVLTVAQRMVEYEVDCMPVVEKKFSGEKRSFKILGRISKTSITKVFVECGMGRG